MAALTSNITTTYCHTTTTNVLNYITSTTTVSNATTSMSNVMSYVYVDIIQRAICPLSS